MAGMTPIERLEQLRGNPNAPAATLDALRQLYAAYLRMTDGGKTELTDRLRGDATIVGAVSHDGKEFTRHMFHLIQTLGGGRTLHRAIVV